MTTPQKSYRDLAKGEVIKEWDVITGTKSTVPKQVYGDKCESGFQRPIHRQPDGSWRDEGEERKSNLVTKPQLEELSRQIHTVLDSPHHPSNKTRADAIARHVCFYFDFPLEPEQEEWEKEYHYAVLPAERNETKEIIFKLGWQAHERKQGEKK